MSDTPIAEVVPLFGRYCLAVNGIYVAQEDDKCHDPTIGIPHWTKRGLEQAAVLINAARWANTAERTKQRGQ